MPAAPLTHHEIIKRAAPLTQQGYKIKLAACDRAARYIEFESTPGHDETVTVIHAMEVDEDDKQLFTRILVHTTGLVSTLTAIVGDLQAAIDTFSQIPLERQIQVSAQHVIAFSFLLAPDYRKKKTVAVLKLRYACAHVASLELRVDTSTGGGMPADVRLLVQGKASAYLRENLADGTDLPLDHRAAQRLRLAATSHTKDVIKPELPDDILAVLGPQWRPLQYQGDHWKGVLRQLDNQDKRTAKAEKFIRQALTHLHDTLTSKPALYQQRHGKARWQVYTRRLQPVMVFFGILALMPISYLFVSSGTMTIHPLALGLTPLLMVGVVVLTAREIPVMEIPPRPAPLASDAWDSSQSHPASQARLTEEH